MYDLIIVYNTCGISKKDNLDWYNSCIESILKQDSSRYKYRLIVSDCLSSETTREKLLDRWKKDCDFCFFDEVLPVNVTFNKSVLESIDRYGKTPGFMYIDSGVNFRDQDFVINRMADVLYKNVNVGMVSCHTDDDTGYEGWFPEGIDLNVDNIVPVGRAHNLHCQIFSYDLVSYYGKPIPDIFAANCTESVFSFLVAAIGLYWIIVGGFHVQHVKAVDGPSSGFGCKHIWDYTFRSPRTMVEIISDPEGIEAGFGYEECNRILMHKPECFENNICTNDRLAPFIKENLFLKPDRLDYNSLNSRYIQNV